MDVIDRQTRKLTILLGVAMLTALAGIFYCVTSVPGSGPDDAFRAHLAALDEGRIDDANELVDITCGKVTVEDVDAAKSGLGSAGYTFQTAFQVGEVWLNERGTEAILELQTPANLPLPGVQGMMKVDGEWLLSCG